MTTTPTVTAPVLELTFPQPQDWPTSNHRHHHMALARHTKYWRDLATIQARRQWKERDPLSKARIVVTFHWPDRRRRDVANWYPTVKPVVDGIVTAGVLTDDCHPILTGPDLRVGAPGPRRFVVRVWDEGGDGA